MAKSKFQTIDVTTLDKDITINAKTKNSGIYFKNLSNFNDLTFEGATESHSNTNDLTITVNEHKIILKDYFAKNGKFPVKTIKTDLEQYSSVNLINYVNDNYIKGVKQNIVNGMTKTINGTIFDDVISPLGNNQTINAGKGNDLIFADTGNDTMIGGLGTNEVLYEYLKDTSELFPQKTFGKDTIKLTKGETLYLDVQYDDDDGTYVNLSFKRGTGKGVNDLIITNNANDKDTITIKNYYGKETGATVYINGKNLAEDTSDFLAFDETHVVKSKITGSALADVINASDVDQQYKTVKKKGKKVQVETNLTINAGAGDDEITGSAFGDTINAGSGDDIIYGSANADNISGGKGENRIIYTSYNQLDGDKIYLTKDENLTIDISGITNHSVTYTQSGKNLDVTISGINFVLINGVITAQPDSKTFTIMNFAEKDVTGVNGKVELKLNDNSTVDLRNEIMVNSTSGTWHNDIINKAAYEIKKKGSVVTDVTKKGLSINGKGGNDNVIGTNYSDIIKGGAGDDKIKAGTGNDKIYGDGGENTFIFEAGDGNDTVYSGKGTDTLGFGEISLNDIKFSKGTAKKTKNDLIVKYTDNDSVTVKDYYALNKKKQQTTSVKSIITKEGTYKLSDLLMADNIIASANNESKYIGSDSNDAIIVTGYAEQEVLAGKGNDKIYIATTSTNAHKITLNAGDGTKEIIYNEGCEGARVEFYFGTYDYNVIKQGDDLCVSYSDNNNDMVILKDFFNKNINYTYVNDAENHLAKIESQPVKIYGTSGDDTLSNLQKVYSSIYPGTGNDTLNIRTTMPAYLYLNKGDGIKTINYSENGYSMSINFEEIIPFTDITAHKNGDNLVINYSEDGSDAIIFPDFFKQADFLQERLGNISLKGSGYQTVINSILNNIGLHIEGNGDIDGTKYADIITGSGYDDNITPGQGKDTVNAGLGDNVIEFGNNDGNNTIISGGGNDTVLFADKEDFSDISAQFENNDLNIELQNGTKTVLKDFKNGGHSVKSLQAGANTQDLSVLDGVTSGNIIFGDNNSAIINGTGGDDIIYGGYNNNSTQTIQSLYGNNIIVANDGTKSKTIYIGEGNDTVYTSANNEEGSIANTVSITSVGKENGGHDVIHWRGAATVLQMYNTHTKDDVIYVRQDDDLVIRYGEDNSVTVKEYYTDTNTQAGIGNKIHIIFKTEGDPESMTMSEALAYSGLYNYVTNGVGTDGNDYMVGSLGADTINAGDGNDIIRPYGGADEINLGAGNDTVLSGADGKIITAVSGSNVINLGSGNNTVYAGVGSDTINSGSGENNIEFSANDTVNDTYRYGGGEDTLIFKGDDLSDLIVDRTGENVVLKQGNNKTVTITNYNNPEHILNIEDKSGNVTTIDNLSTKIGSLTTSTAQTLTTGIGNDTILTGLGSDVINSGAGENTIALALGETGNNDSYTYANGTDVFLLTGVNNFDNLKLQKVDNDLLVAYTGDLANNTLTINDFYTNQTVKDSISFKAGESNPVSLATLISKKGVDETIYGTDDADELDYSESLKAVTVKGGAGGDTITGSAYADRLFGEAGTDSIIGGDGSDYINGGSGADIMLGGAGSDTYEIDSDDWGNGQDVITDLSGDSDTLKINTTSDKINLFFDVTLTKEGGNVTVTNGLANYTTGTDLYIIKETYELNNAKTSNGVKITNFFTEGGKIENVLIPDGENWVPVFDSSVMTKFGQIIANWLYTNGFDSTQDAITNGTDAQKSALYKIYHPMITTAQSTWSEWPVANSVMIGMGENKQQLYSRTGNDIIYPTDTTQDRNQIDSGAGDDIIYGSSGPIEVRAQAGNDIVYAGTGGSKNIYVGIGNDTVYTSTDASSNYMYFTEYGQFIDGGHDTVYWLGGTGDNIVYIFGRELSEVTLAKDNNDLKLLYGDDNSVTLKDYYKAGNDNMGEYVSLVTQDMGYQKKLKNVFTQKGVLNYISYENDTGSQSGSSESDYIYAGENVIGINAYGGSDTVIVNGWTTVYTNINSASGKDTTEGVVDKVIIRSGNQHEIHAQSETNIIVSNCASTDNYFAYIDQKTSITDAGGTDSLTLTNTNGKTDGNKSNLHVLFNVSKGYDYDSTDSETLFTGNILITDTENTTKANYDLWKADGSYIGVSITGNTVERINSSDSTAYVLTNEKISELAENISSWLSTYNGGSFDSVNALMQSNDATHIEALIAKFDEASWT